MSNFIVQSSGAEPLPNGAYSADFVGVTPFSNDKIQDRWRWVWKVVTGKHAGREATALTDAKITLQNIAGRLIAGMAGRPLQTGDDVSAIIDGFKGKRYVVTVAPGPKGGKPGVQSAALPVEM